MSFRIHPGSLLVAALLLSSLGSSALWAQTADRPSDNDTRSWVTLQHSRKLTVRVDPAVGLSRFGGISVGSVTYTGRRNMLRPAEKEKLTGLLRDRLTRDLQIVPMNGDPGHTLKVDADITRIRKSHPWVNVVTAAAVFVPLDLGVATVQARVVDADTGKVLAVIDAEGCGQVYQFFPSLQALGQSKLLLKKDSRRIASGIAQMNARRPGAETALEEQPVSGQQPGM